MTPLEHPHPLLRELIGEVDEALTAIVDDLIPALLEQPPNMERVGAARDRIAAARDAVSEMRDTDWSDE